MKRIITYLIIVCLGLTAFFSLYKQKDKNLIELAKDGNGWEIRVKGIRKAKDFVVDKDMNCYIAYSDRVQFIDAYGKSYILFENKQFDISSLEFKDDILYYSSGNSVMSYNTKTKEQKEIMGSLPNLGDYNESKIFIKDDILYITIGSATNSGIVGEDNTWIKSNPFFHDLSPKDITINANTTRNLNTGAFVPFNTKNISGQTISAHSPGNSSIMAYNIKNGSSWLYAWGIRNITGIDFNSEGRFFMAVGGMEDRGSRPVKGDSDYVFELKEKTWYGWPDYSGGDPVNSPKFKGANNSRINFVLDKHPTVNPPAPLYQHKNLSSIKSLAVDKQGVLGEKDSIYFYDSKDNIIYTIAKTGLSKELYRLKNNSSINSMKYIGNRFYILDSSNGYLAFLDNKSEMANYKAFKNVAYYILGVLGVVIIVVIWKFKN
jgi:glucose/arabinose dehydrogenase